MPQPETLTIKQVKFSNGEISPMNYGDTAHSKYPASLRTCQNWLPVPQGALVKRPGFAFIAPVKDSTYTPRLIPFVFSDDLTFVLEFGNLYIRFYRTSKYVGVDGNLHVYGDSYGGGYYELVTPFTTAMLPYLKYSQVGNIITICYGGQVAGVAALAPRDLTHTSGVLTPWTIAATLLKAPVPYTAPFPAMTQSAVGGAAWSAVISYSLGHRVTYLNQEWISIQNVNLNNIPAAGSLFWTLANDNAHPSQVWSWVNTALLQGPDGIVYETAPSVAFTQRGTLASDRPLAIDLNVIVGLTAGWTELFRRVYRSTTGVLYGLVMETTLGQGFTDQGQAADYTRQPPKGKDPFLINAVDSYPALVGYLDQRRLWAASALLPSSGFLSKVGDLYNYDNQNTPGADTDALNFLLASEVLEQIRSFVAMRRGLLLTSQGEWAVAGQGGAPVSRSNIDAKRQSRWGANWLNPIIIGTGVLFNTAKSNMVRDLYPLYGLYADIWDGQDLSVMARHLLDLHMIKDWAFQSTPYPVVWAVREDGVLLSLTYQHAPPSFGQQIAEGVVAWGQHVPGVNTDKSEAICAVPEPPDDAVYAVTQRRSNGALVRYIERMENPLCPASPYAPGVSDVRYGRYLDSVTTYDGHNDKIGYAGIVATIDSIDVPGSTDPVNYAVGSKVKVTVAGGPFVAGDAANPYGSGFVFDLENILVLNVVGLGAVKGSIVGYTSSTVITIELIVAMTQVQVTAWRAGGLYWAIAKGSFALANINAYAIDSNDANLARGMICLADGDVQVPAAGTTAGVLKLDIPAVVIHVGLAYNCDASLLDLWHPSVELRNRFRNIVRMGFEVAGSRDMWVGKDFASLTQWEQRTVLDAYGVMGLATGYFEEFVIGDWAKGSGGVLRHFQPLPAILASVLREVSLGGT